MADNTVVTNVGGLHDDVAHTNRWMQADNNSHKYSGSDVIGVLLGRVQV
jgi:hypothetical protein